MDTSARLSTGLIQERHARLTPTPGGCACPLRGIVVTTAYGEQITADAYLGPRLSQPPASVPLPC
jgi:hypothetical protein